MREIEENAGVHTVLSRLRFLALRLEPRADTAALAAPVKGARDLLESRYEAWSELNDRKIAAYGALMFADDLEDQAIAALARRVKVAVEGNLGSEHWQRLFEVAPSEATGGMADDRQNAFAQNVLDTLTTHPDYAPYADRVAGLQAARDAVVAARAARDTLERQVDAAWNEVQIAEAAARDAYRDTYPQLLLIFPGRKRQVESFFYQPSRKKKAPTGRSGLRSTGAHPHGAPDPSLPT